MSTPLRKKFSVNGQEFSVLSRHGTGRPIVLIHGGGPNVGAIAHGAHFWEPSFRRLTGRSVFAPDLPGFGSSSTADGEKPFSWHVDNVGAIMSELGIGRAHVVGYGSGGLAALLLASRYPDIVDAVTCVASAEAAPTGDGLEDLTLAYPPLPRWTSKSQKWALERLTYSNQLTPGLLDGCVMAAQVQAYDDRESGIARAAAWKAALLDAKISLFKILRESGIPAPVRLIWSENDSQTSVAQGVALYELIAARQPDSHFHIINRAGSFPFLEQDEAFWALVGSVA